MSLYGSSILHYSPFLWILVTHYCNNSPFITSTFPPSFQSQKFATIPLLRICYLSSFQVHLLPLFSSFLLYLSTIFPSFQCSNSLFLLVPSTSSTFSLLTFHLQILAVLPSFSQPFFLLFVIGRYFQHLPLQYFPFHQLAISTCLHSSSLLLSLPFSYCVKQNPFTGTWHWIINKNVTPPLGRGGIHIFWVAGNSWQCFQADSRGKEKRNFKLSWGSLL